ncbi:MAG: PD40 domain-containing protein [Bacteroidetes bacterium]|nr:PD40 domain-containing protein [Bacteroidota bacterium]
MQNGRYLLSFLFVMCFTFLVKAQSSKEIEEEAFYFFSNKDYKKAYELYDKLSAKNPKEIDYKFKLGYCCLYYPEKKSRAIEIFEDMKKTGKIKDLKDIDYYLGKAYHVNYRFQDAIKTLETYISSVGSKAKEDDKFFIEDAKNVIKNCNNGIELIDKKIQAEIINIGPPINTDEVEGVPVITADESMMIFTYAGSKSMGGKLNEELKPDPNGEYREDVFMSVKTNDSLWSEPTPVTSVNTNGNDAAIAISPDGTKLFSFASNNDLGDLYMSVLNGTEWSKPEKLNKNINSEAWEGSCSMSADERFLYFASERKGGLGGRDIYVSQKVNGDWGPAVNMGPKINTPNDEDAPFIHPDGITLFFSSKGHSSIGGYDIMFSVQKDGEWLEPRNMGIPLNTTEDDRYYVINAKGDKGFFSSDRGGAGGKGKQDIYMVTPGILGEKPIIAMLKGTVYGNDKPIQGTISVIRLNVGEKLSEEEKAAMQAQGITPAGNVNIGDYLSNSSSGKYLVALSPGSVYKIKASAPGYESAVEELDIENLEKFLEVRKDFYLYSEGTNTASPNASTATAVANTTTSTTAITSVNNPTTTTTTTQTDVTTTENPSKEPCNPGAPLPDFTPLKGKSLNDPAVYKQLLSIAGNHCAGSMIFKVQIAAYRHPENYKYEHLKQYGKPEVVNYPDGITRFTQLEFKTIKEAEVQRQKAISKGQKDAWIVGFVDGKRYTLEELIALDFLGKSVN